MKVEIGSIAVAMAAEVLPRTDRTVRALGWAFKGPSERLGKAEKERQECVLGLLIGTGARASVRADRIMYGK